MERFDWIELGEAEAAPRRGGPSRQAPTDGPSYYRAARAMRQAGHFSAAAKYYERAIGFDDHHYAARVELVDTLVRAGNIAQADQASHAALDAYRQVRLLYAARALALAHRGDVEPALDHVQVALDEGRPWYALCVRAETMLRASLDNRSDALALLEEAAEKCSARWDMHFVAGCMLLDAGWPTLAAGYFSESAHHAPSAVASWICLGDCFNDLKLHDQALFYYEKATEIEPTHEIALRRRRECTPFLYGLTRVFRRERLRARWNRAFEELQQQWRPGPDDW
jgi:tetratricopeptide (TPR) repeat protein